MRTRPDVVFRVLGDAAVIVDLSSNQIYELNETGTIIWQLLTDGHSPDETAAALSQRYDITAADAAAEVEALLDRLRAVGLVMS